MSRLERAEAAAGRAFRSMERHERREAMLFFGFLVLVFGGIAILVIAPVVQGNSSLQGIALIGGGFLLFLVLVFLVIMVGGRHAYRAMMGMGREFRGRGLRRRR